MGVGRVDGNSEGTALGESLGRAVEGVAVGWAEIVGCPEGATDGTNETLGVLLGRDETEGIKDILGRLEGISEGDCDGRSVGAAEAVGLNVGDIVGAKEWDGFDEGCCETEGDQVGFKVGNGVG